MTPRKNAIGKLLLTTFAVCFALGTGALSAGTKDAGHKGQRVAAAFGDPLSNGHYGAYQDGAVFSQFRVCRSYGRIIINLEADGFKDFSNIRIDQRYIRMDARKGAGQVQLKVNRCSGNISRRWTS